MLEPKKLVNRSASILVSELVIVCVLGDPESGTRGPIESQHCPRPTLLYVLTPKNFAARKVNCYSGRIEGIGDPSNFHTDSPGFLHVKMCFLDY